MISQLIRLFKKEYRTLNKIEISKKGLLGNYQYLSSLNPKIKIAPVLKSNAYGHGFLEVAKILDEGCADWRVPFFCVDSLVDSLYEAYELIKTNTKTPILIMGYTDPENFKVKKLPFSYAVFDLETARVLSKYQPRCSIHIFVDTGMHREGVPIENLPDFLTAMKQFNNLTIEGLMSHLASADDKNDSLNKLQAKNFQMALKICQQYKISPKWIHLSNSDGLLNYLPTWNVGIQNMARVGLALYGISDNPNLKPVLLGVLPIGYYDGVDRRLSNKGFVTVDDKVCPIIGRVSMNITTIDLSKVLDPKIGDEVFVYSNNRTDANSIENAARLCGTIPYDLLVNLASSTKRVIT